MKRIILLLGLATLFFGCNKAVYKAHIYRRSFAMVFSETKNVELKESYYNYNQPRVYFQINLDMTSSCRYDDTGDRKDVYDAMCEKYGDMTYNREDAVAPGAAPSFQMYSFVSVDIVSDADFDDLHPAGSSLAGLFIFEAYSCKPFIDSGYTMCKYIENERIREKPIYPVYEKVPDLTPYDLMLLFTSTDHIEGHLYLESLPALSKVHTFTVTFTDERGETFSDSIEMTFE